MSKPLLAIELGKNDSGSSGFALTETKDYREKLDVLTVSLRALRLPLQNVVLNRVLL